MQLVKSVVRAVDMLQLFTSSRPRMTLSRMAEQLDMSRATTHRYGYTLRHVNLLRYDPLSGEYSLGPRAVILGSLALAGLPIIRIAEPHIERLVQAAQQTVVLSIWDGAHPVIVVSHNGVDRFVRVSVQVGARLDPATTAQGMVFLAHMQHEELASLDGFSESTLAAIRKDVQDAGVAVNNSQAVAGFRTIAAPVFQEQRIHAALAIIGTSAAISEDPNSKTAKQLRETAAALSAELAFIEE